MCVWSTRPGKYRYSFEWNTQRYSKAGFVSVIEAKKAELIHKQQIRETIPRNNRKVKRDLYFTEHRVRKETQIAINQGILKRPATCCKCGKRCKPYAHHKNYSQPLKVQWLCPKCHADKHRHQFCKPKNVNVKWPYAINYKNNPRTFPQETSPQEAP